MVDGGGTAPAREQGDVQIDAPVGWKAQEEVAQKLSVRHHHDDVDAQPGQRFHDNGGVDPYGGQYRDVVRLRELLHRPRLNTEVAPLSAVRLGDDGHDVHVGTVRQRGKEGAGELIGAHEDHPEGARSCHRRNRNRVGSGEVPCERDVLKPVN